MVGKQVFGFLKKKKKKRKTSFWTGKHGLSQLIQFVTFKTIERFLKTGYGCIINFQEKPKYWEMDSNLS